jgi:phage baseplate assembly protein gpV
VPFSVLLRLAIVLAVACAPSDGAVAQPLPPSPAIHVDHGRLGLAPGTSATVIVSGALAPLAIQPSFDGVDATYDAATHRLTVTARVAGSGTLALTDAAGNTATIAVLVAPLAGTIPPAVDVALAGTVTQTFALGQIRAAIERALQRAPGTSLDVHGLTVPATLAPGDAVDTTAGVTIAGRGAYVDVSARTAVHVHVDAGPPPDPAVLWYSDDPEQLDAQTAGVLFHATLDPAIPARLFAYHVAAGTPRTLLLVFRSTAGAHVQVLGTVGGPSPAFAYVGQQSSARFLTERTSGESAVDALSPGVPYAIGLGTLQPGDLLEVIDDLRVVDGGAVDVDVVATAPGDALPPLDAPEVAGDTHGRRGEFALAGIAPIALSLAAGDPDPPPVSVGDALLPNLRAGGRPLGGDYGVVRPIVLHLTNPLPDAQTLYLYELTSGSGGATTTAVFDGDGAPTLVPCVDDATQPRLVKAFPLAGAQTLTVTGTFMTDGASSYPIRFGLSTKPPAPAGGCAPRT